MLTATGSHAGRRLAVGAVLASLLAAPAALAADPVSLNAQVVPLAEKVPPGARVGAIRFLGMLAIPKTTVAGLRLSQLSDIAWDESTGVLYAISDKGALLHLRPIFSDDRLVDVELMRAVSLRELKTGQPLKQRRADAEGLALAARPDGSPELIVSFERFPRIVGYQPDGYAIGEHPLPTPLRDRKAYRNDNRMLEALCHDPERGLLTMPEQPLITDARGHNRIYDMGGRSWRYPISKEDNVVALACLGESELLVVERDLGALLWNFRITLKRVALAATPGATLTPKTLVTLDTTKGFQIDNFEGITHHRGNRFFLISDDNDFMLQRTLLLYFEIVDDSASSD
jgi:hypothetical protein